MPFDSLLIEVILRVVHAFLSEVLIAMLNYFSRISQSNLPRSPQISLWEFRVILHLSTIWTKKTWHLLKVSKIFSSLAFNICINVYCFRPMLSYLGMSIINYEPISEDDHGAVATTEMPFCFFHFSLNVKWVFNSWIWQFQRLQKEALFHLLLIYLSIFFILADCSSILLLF